MLRISVRLNPLRSKRKINDTNIGCGLTFEVCREKLYTYAGQLGDTSLYEQDDNSFTLIIRSLVVNSSVNELIRQFKLFDERYEEDWVLFGRLNEEMSFQFRGQIIEFNKFVLDKLQEKEKKEKEEKEEKEKERNQIQVLNAVINTQLANEQVNESEQIQIVDEQQATIPLENVHEENAPLESAVIDAAPSELSLDEKDEKKLSACRICCENTADCAFYPCGHIAVCLQCKHNFERRFVKCLICKQIYTVCFKIYLC